MHPNTATKFINDEMGYGIFATEKISKGTITYVSDGFETKIFPHFFNQLNPTMQEEIVRYAHVDNRGVQVIKWDRAKFVNHSCFPNTISTGYGFEIAIRPIHPGEEITCDYGLSNLSKEMKCLCGAKFCRETINQNDIEKYHLIWDRKVKSALNHFFYVEQPLLPLADPKTLGELMNFLKGEAPFQSVLQKKNPRIPSAFAA